MTSCGVKRKRAQPAKQQKLPGEGGAKRGRGRPREQPVEAQQGGEQEPGALDGPSAAHEGDAGVDARTPGPGCAEARGAEGEEVDGDGWSQAQVDALQVLPLVIST